MQQMTETCSDASPVALGNWLTEVQTPGQYIGGEWNAVSKDHSQVRLRFALAYPDTYAIGMSHLGLQVLYSILNGLEDVAAERVYAPWVDMEAQMRERGIPLFSIESRTPVAEFDVLGFSLQHPMCYTNLLNMLDLAGLPLRSAERDERHPLVLAGGSGALAPEPVAEFIDVFVLGDGEDKVVELANALRSLKDDGASRAEQLAHLAANVSAVYVPALFPHGNGAIRQERIPDLDSAPFPLEPIVPSVQAVHDRIVLEVMRGCARGCRFCQAGMIKRPVRCRAPETLIEQAQRCYENTGHDEISLLSLCTSDYPGLEDLIHRLSDVFTPKRVNLSLPSLRVDEQLFRLPALVNVVRKSGLTIAAETADEGLRQAINKDISDQELFDAAAEAFRRGWQVLKLYFMIGLPGETEEHVAAIPAVAEKLAKMGRKIRPSAGKLNITVSSFVPQPHTPFQWEPMASMERLRELQDRMRRAIRRRSIRVKFHDVRRSFLEGVFARGDRALGDVLVRAWRKGCRFDAWGEQLRFSLWMEAFDEAGIDPHSYVSRERREDEPLPWDHIDVGVKKSFLLKERQRALEGQATPSCLDGKCTGCGACDRGVREGQDG